MNTILVADALPTHTLINFKQKVLSNRNNLERACFAEINFAPCIDSAHIRYEVHSFKRVLDISTWDIVSQNE